MLKGDETNYRESLRSARSWLETYFDTAANDVRSAISDLIDMESSEIKTHVPQIGGALGQLRALRSSPDPIAVQPATPDPEAQGNVETDQ